MPNKTASINYSTYCTSLEDSLLEKVFNGIETYFCEFLNKNQMWHKWTVTTLKLILRNVNSYIICFYLSCCKRIHYAERCGTHAVILAVRKLKQEDWHPSLGCIVRFYLKTKKKFCFYTCNRSIWGLSRQLLRWRYTAWAWQSENYERLNLPLEVPLTGNEVGCKLFKWGELFSNIKE